MATKKTATKKTKRTVDVTEKFEEKELVETPEESVADVALKLDEADMLRLTRLSARIQLADAKRQVLQLEKEAYIASIDPERKIQAFDNSIGNAYKTYGDLLASYRILVEGVNEKMGIDLEEYVFDDETGFLFAVKDAG